MGSDLNIEHPEENGSGHIVQQIDAQRSIDLSYYGYRLIDPGFA